MEEEKRKYIKEGNRISKLLSDLNDFSERYNKEYNDGIMSFVKKLITNFEINTLNIPKNPFKKKSKIQSKIDSLVYLTNTETLSAGEFYFKNCFLYNNMLENILGRYDKLKELYYLKGLELGVNTVKSVRRVDYFAEKTKDFIFLIASFYNYNDKRTFLLNKNKVSVSSHINDFPKSDFIDRLIEEIYIRS